MLFSSNFVSTERLAQLPFGTFAQWRQPEVNIIANDVVSSTFIPRHGWCPQWKAPLGSQNTLHPPPFDICCMFIIFVHRRSGWCVVMFTTHIVAKPSFLQTASTE